MKGLFSVLGLITALLFSTAVTADIYSQAIYHSPDRDNSLMYKCSSVISDPSFPIYVDSQTCFQSLQSFIERLGQNPEQSGFFNPSNFTMEQNGSLNGHPIYIVYFDYCYSADYCQGTSTKHVRAGFISDPVSSNSSTCPPSDYPNYIYSKDDDGDGQADRCFNPMELDSASKCADAYNGGMNLEAGNNTAPTVCKTYLDGARCAFSKTVTQGGIAYYSPNLEQSCFGNDSLPEYDETPPSTMPGDEQCSPYGSGYVCAADPSNYCDAQGVCIDGCGYVNGQFACFRDQECTGDSCEPAPINCESSPDAAVCKDPEPDPDPEPCTGDDCDPTDPTNPGTGGGGSSFQLDYDRLINGIVGGLTDDSLTPDFKLTQDAINDANSALQEKADEFNDSSLFNSIEDTVSGNIFGTVDNMLPSGGTCTVFNWWGHTLDFCAAAEKVRSLLYFVFAFITFIYLRDLFYSTVTPRKE